VGADKEPFYTTTYNMGCLTLKKNKLRYLKAQSFLYIKQDIELATPVAGELFVSQSEQRNIAKLNAT